MCPFKTAAAVVGAMISNNPRVSTSWGVTCDEQHCELWSDFDEGCCFSSLAGSAVDALQSISMSLSSRLCGGAGQQSGRAGGLAAAFAESFAPGMQGGIAEELGLDGDEEIEHS